MLSWNITHFNSSWWSTSGFPHNTWGTWLSGHKTKRRWFKPRCKQLMLCVVPLDKTLYLHFLTSTTFNLVPDDVGMVCCLIQWESITVIGLALRRPGINTNTVHIHYLKKNLTNFSHHHAKHIICILPPYFSFLFHIITQWLRKNNTSGCGNCHVQIQNNLKMENQNIIWFSFINHNLFKIGWT